ncbi:MAG: LacI family DNA-binding transcriptional regulator [Cytophagales bacterium]|nr:LacI family DNA-binding transcriptional regulator [Armatimonadota bacterium]
MSVSIRELAEKAGVSPGTVSHVLNGNTAARIAPATQDRVRRAAEEMGYRPNRMARSLGRRRTDTIGLLISGLKNPFFVEIMETAERLAMNAGYSVQLDSAPSINGTFGGHSKLSGWPVDGAIMWGIGSENIATYLEQQDSSIPVVYLGAARSGATDWVSFDYFEGGRLAMEHLIGRGRRRIALVSPYAFGEDRHEEPRHAAYMDACRRTGQTPNVLLTDAEETRQAGLRIAERIAALPAGERPDALFCHNDMIAIGVYCGLLRGGIRVPEDVAVVGFDGVVDGQFLERPLTTIRTSGEDLCRHAFDILSLRLRGDRETPPRQIVLPTELTIGGTS